MATFINVILGKFLYSIIAGKLKTACHLKLRLISMLIKEIWINITAISINLSGEETRIFCENLGAISIQRCHLISTGILTIKDGLHIEKGPGMFWVR